MDYEGGGYMEVEGGGVVEGERGDVEVIGEVWGL